MYIYVLGSAAGGGFPQWNCNCPNCHGVRTGSIQAKARTQSSIAVSENGTDWVLLNASPDIRQQLFEFKAAQPARKLRDTGITSVILMDSQLDHTTGLLTLREGCPMNVWCTEMVHQDLTSGFPVFNMLKHWNGGLQYNEINPKQAFKIDGFENLEFLPLIIKSAAPPYSPHRNDPHDGDNIALIIKDHKTQKQLFYAPGLGKIDDQIMQIMQSSDCVMIDGTLWTDDEMQQTGVGTKTGREMGHLYISGEGGSLSYLNQLSTPKKVLIHINNTNPILNENSSQFAELKANGVEVAYDGMQIEL
ncbi:pyrroloquinoline quinone biosynthesis protein PqqB [Acinetobacter sp. IRS14]|uniref:Coenzyme PQQ synthesis protein B n=1 Tax=Acinetobacter oleivorans (strain JCM 16667 / KCTC 23045 / DR1) TaxID=436717 RepID=A0AAN0P8N3_ACISD|nr:MULTISPECIES: pyrroloquinoline quinone biosynthesis protein PqqB [Acinetobacter]OBA13354.1 pyrroloquinoline quinone biosynthesis protein PqqB [Acinetobacter calcoaceticus]HBU86840.1 pyrroloquinoline quinone biosynthesis protein PqqB [Acinetobacter sp.]ADI90861.1 pyrroloquinoline quinone biosynthesis protein PqqB [Acinetobacter oleivorans DR1]ESK45613.1 coenzyme PQQ synthesis protein B [Acinetobacter oleivorans CIP 110421]KIE86357.1 pyrroloquinoline quinone biosynthesis protein PqqB [Acineto